MASDDADKAPSPLTGDPKRQATDAIRGYIYQIHQTVYHWLDLVECPEATIYIEAAEDFDVYSPDHATVHQVKDTKASGALTLASRSARDAVTNYLQLYQNSDRPFEYRYLTTSEVGREQALEFPSGLPGIKYWEGVQKGNLPAGHLKAQLLRLDWPDQVKSWLASASAEDFAAKMVRRFHWCCGAPSLDALVSIIEQRLAIVGIKFGLLPNDSARAYPALLKHVALTAANAPYGKLDVAMLMRLIQEAASIQVSVSAARLGVLSANAEALRPSAQLSVVRPPGSLKGLLFREAVIAAAVAAIRSSGVAIVVGPTGMGKSSACYHAIEVVQATAGHTALDIRFTSLRDAPGERVSAAVRDALLTMLDVTNPISFFFDDFNFEGVHFDAFQLAMLIEAVRLRGGFCIFTSYTPPSVSAGDMLGIPDTSVIRPGHLDVDEAAQLAQKHRLRSDDKLQAWAAALMMASSAGHPQLIHALVVSLARRHWPVSKLRPLLSGTSEADVSGEKRTARKRLVESAPNADVRALLYRLSVLIGDFSRQVALKVGAIAPAIKNPGEALDVLVGPWIEDRAEGRYSVSPLLTNAAAEVSDADELVKLHYNIAEGILSSEKLDAKDFQNVILHARIGNNADAARAAVGFLMSILANHPKTASAFWLVLLLREDEGSLFPSDAAVSCMLRTCQFLIAAETEKPDQVSVIGAKMMREIAALEHEKRNGMYLMSAFWFLSKPGVPVSGRQLLDCILELRRLRSDDEFRETFDRMEDPQKPSLPPGFQLHQFLFSAGSLKLASVDEFIALLRELDALSPEVRADILKGLSLGGGAGGNLFVQRGWSSEVQQQGSLGNL